MFRASLCPSSGAQQLYRWLLPVVLGALVYRSLVWCGAVGYVSGLWGVFFELLMMGIMVPETCSANNKLCNEETNLLHRVGPLIYMVG